MKLKQLEIWSNLGAVGGTRLGGTREVAAAQRVQKLDGTDELTIVLDRQSALWPHVLERNVCRLTFMDGSVHEWRIARVDDARENGAFTGSFLALSPLLDLGERVVERVEADGTVVHDYALLSQTPAALVSHILAGAQSYFASGTIDPTDRVDFKFAFDSPLAALRELAKITGSELAVRRNGSTNWLVDLVTKVGAGASVPRFRYRKNIRGLKRTVNAAELTTRLYARGGADEAGIHLTIAEASWKITAKIGNTLTLEGDPVLLDDLLNGLFAEESGGTVVGITDSIAPNQVVLSDATQFAVNELVTFRRNATGEDLTFLDHPTGKTLYGIVAGRLEADDLPPVDNLVLNADLASWAGGVPANWSAVNGATISENADARFTSIGGRSARVQATADGQGIQSDAFTVAPVGDRKFFSGAVWLYVVSGAVRVEWVHSNGIVFPERELAFTSQTGPIVVKIEGQELPSGTLRVRVVAKDGAAEFYLDAAQVVRAGGAPDFFRGRAANELWKRAKSEFAARGLPKISYELDVADLTTLDPATWPYDALTLGGDVLAEDDPLGVDVTVRGVEIARDLLTGADVKLTLSNRPEDLTDRLTLQSRRGRLVGPEEQDPDRRPQILSIAIDVTDAGAVNATIQADTDSGSIKFVGRKTGFPSAADVRARPATDGRNVSGTVIDAATGSPMVLSPGQFAYVSAIAYQRPGGTGQEGPLAQARAEYLGGGEGTNRVESATVIQRGNRAYLGVTLDNGAVSFKWAVSTTDFPAAGTGTCQAAPAPWIDLGAYAYGDVIYVTVTPYSAASCGGVAGPERQVRFRLQVADDQFDEPTGKRKRIAPFDDSKYAVTASTTDGLTADVGVKEAGGKPVNRLFAKPLAADPDTLDSAPDGVTWKRVTGVNASNRVVPASTEYIGAARVDELLVRGTGLNNSANTVVRVGRRTDVNGSNPGLTLSVLKRSDHSNLQYRRDGTPTGTLAANQVYIDFNSSGADQLAMRDALVELRTNGNGTRAAGEWGDDILVILSSWDFWRTNNANGDLLVDELKLHGATEAIRQMADRMPYILIGIPGIGEGRGIEVMTRTGANDPYAEYSGLLVDGSVPGMGKFAEKSITDALTRSVGADKVGAAGAVAFLSTIQESGGKGVNRLFAKSLPADPDTLDSAPDGSTYKKVLNVASGLVQTGSIADAAVTSPKASVVVNSGETITATDYVVLKADGSNTEVRAFKADADTFDPVAVIAAGIALESAGGAGTAIKVALLLTATVNKGSESWAASDVGKPVYMSTTAGQVTKTKPVTGGSHLYRAGAVFNTSGVILLQPEYLGKNVSLILRPNSDITVGNWTKNHTASAASFSEINEDIGAPDGLENDGFSLTSTAQTEAIEHGLTDSERFLAVAATLRVRYRDHRASGSQQMNFTYMVKNGSTILEQATRSTTAADGSYVEVSLAIPQADLDTLSGLTNWNDLRVRFEATISTNATGGNDIHPDIDTAELEIVYLVAPTA